MNKMAIDAQYAADQLFVSPIQGNRMVQLIYCKVFTD